MSEDGVFINIDGNANRVAAYAYGPKHVLLIVGMNKVVKSEEDALHRARNEAAPINAQRFLALTHHVPKTEAVLTARVRSVSAVRF